MGLFDRFKTALKKTRDSLTGGLLRVFRGKLDEAKLEEIEDALLTSDVGPSTTRVLMEALEQAWKRREITEAAQALPYFKELLVERLSAGSGLVEAATVQGPHGSAVMLIYKRLDKPAFVFTGMLFMPPVEKSWLWTLVARERGTTGVRESVVTAQLMNAGKLTIESYEAEWAQDPYDSDYRGVDRSTLRYASDDELCDSQFPNHPLSKVRRELRRLLTVAISHAGSP